MVNKCSQRRHQAIKNTSRLLAYASGKMKLSSSEMGKIEREAGCGGGYQSILTKTFCRIGPGLRKKE